MKLRFYLSIVIAQLAYLFLKITKLSSGTAIIGLLTLKICPNFLNYANEFITSSKIYITGTNGKTTTSGILSHLIKKSNHTIINNSVGANMLNGIVNALVLQINPLKKYEYSVIETDEAFVSKVFEKMESNYLLVTNLFEDQTDRFPTPIYTKSIIQKAIDAKPELQLILNADEPISSSLSSNKSPIYYGINDVFDENGNKVEYAKNDFKCPLCDKKMNYVKNFYSQLGYYDCSCGYKRPSVKYLANVILLKDSTKIVLDDNEYEIPLVGLFNAYNALGAIVLALELGINDILENIKTFRVSFGRSEKRELFGHKTLIQLIKNPAGTNEILKTVEMNSNILIAINNNEADGKDISWINQAEFERLVSVREEIVVTGKKAQDMAIRLNNAGIKKVKIIPDIESAVNYLGKNAVNDITILTTYTALLKIDKIKELKKCY